MAGGLALAVAITGGATDLGSLAVLGAVAGLVVGGAQAVVLKKWVWPLVVAASWSAAWVISALVIVDEQRGFATFGLSGAALVTVATGLTLRGLLGRREPKTAVAA